MSGLRFAWLLPLLLAGACRVTSVRIDEAPPIEIEMRTGETDYPEVLGRLGPPARIGTLENGFAFFYGSLNFSEGQLFLPYRFARLAVSEGDNNFVYWVLEFDDDGTLQKMRRVDGRLDLGRGGYVDIYLDDEASAFGAAKTLSAMSAKRGPAIRVMTADGVDLSSLLFMASPPQQTSGGIRIGPLQEDNYIVSVSTGAGPRQGQVRVREGEGVSLDLR